jgi:biopolymer transport protein ExbB/TolQ
MKGFAVLGGLFLALIPFWPIFLIAGIVWYFVAKRNKKKREEEFQRQLALEREKIKAAEALKPSEETPQNTEPTNAEENKNDDDISKYMPKE